MKISSAILQQAFIGLHAKVVRSLNPQYVGIKGAVIDETRNTLILHNGSEEKTIVKNVSVFHFTLPDGTIVEIDGKSISGRPEDRVKRRVRKRW